MKLTYHITYFAIVALLISCSTYSKVAKGDDYQKKFDLAGELFEKKSYEKSIALYEQVYQKAPKTGEGELAYYRIGKAYFFQDDYDMAGYFLGQFPLRYAYSPKAEETTFLAALCAVHNSPNFTLDQHETELAILDLQQFVDRYPNSLLIDSCNHVMDRLRLKLEKKDFEAVKLYSKTENYRSAVVTAETFLDDYPVSQNREIVYNILVFNSCFLAKLSVDEKKMERIEETIKRYNKFAFEFPNSKYLKKNGEMVDDLKLLKETLKK